MKYEKKFRTLKGVLMYATSGTRASLATSCKIPSESVQGTFARYLKETIINKLIFDKDVNS